MPAAGPAIPQPAAVSESVDEEDDDYESGSGRGKLWIIIAAVLVIACIAGSIALMNSGLFSQPGNNSSVSADIDPLSSLNLSGSKGLESVPVYDPSSGISGYAVIGLGDCVDENLKIPQGQIGEEGKPAIPYLWDDNNGLREMKSVKTVKLPSGALEIRGGFGGSPNLEMVLVPATVRSIGPKILENCPKFSVLEYQGTFQQWDAVAKDPEWDVGAPEFTVRCTDGEFSAGAGPRAQAEPAAEADPAAAVAAPEPEAGDPAAVEGEPAADQPVEEGQAPVEGTADAAQVEPAVAAVPEGEAAGTGEPVPAADAAPAEGDGAPVDIPGEPEAQPLVP